MDAEVPEPVHVVAPVGCDQRSGGILLPVTVQFATLAAFHEMTVDFPDVTSDGARLKETGGALQKPPEHP
jgi:hypothetical protein